MLLLLPIFMLFFGWNALFVQCSSENPNSFLGSPCNASDENSCVPQSMYYCRACSSSSDDCRNLHGEVVEGGRCACKSDYTTDEESNTCLSTRIGQSCQIGFQCRRNLGEGSACSDDERVCVCQHPSAPNEAGTRCLTKPGEQCVQSNYCLGYPLLGECSNDGECECRESYAISNANGDSCLPLRYKTGESCTEREQCRAPSDSKTKNRPPRYHNPLYDCVNGACACASDAVPDEVRRECHAKVGYVGQECTVDDQCRRSNLGPSSACTSMYSQPYKICTCAGGSVPMNNYTRCVFGGGPTLIGWPCEREQENQTCSGKEAGSSACSAAGVCECLPQFVPSKRLDECLPIRNQIGDECQEGQQCQSGIPGELSECMKGNYSTGGKVCKCQSGSITSLGGHKCYKVASQVGDPCEVHVQCLAGVGSSLCLNKTCRCISEEENTPAEEYTPLMRRCIAISK